MILRWLPFLSMLGAAALGCAGTELTLMPQEGTHQFSFFDSPTPVYSYNGQIPGPTLTAQEGSILKIEVENHLSEPTSIHWHGLRIDNTMDGVPGITQEPIQSGKSFRYSLRLQEAGTYWYHPHFNAGEQLERGLKGALVVKERHPLPWSQDIVWLIDDWRFQRDGTIYPHFNTHHDLMHDGRWGNAITVNGQTQTEIRVSPGERIRLRLIDGANARIFAPVLEGLPAKVIAVDGRPVSKIQAFDRFLLSPGNRVDLDITIPADAAGKTFALEDRLTQDPILLGKIVVSDDTPVQTPKFEPSTAPDFIPANLFDDIAVSKTWDLNAVRGGQFGIGWSMNNRLWPDADTAGFKVGDPVKIKFVNSSTRLHPMHLHGAFFRVLSVNGKSVAEPFTRDTVLVGPRQTIIIGLVPEHQGIWLAHCHIQTHAESGMMTTIKVE